MMAADSDGCNVLTVVTCKGDLLDPTFPRQLKTVIASLESSLGGKWHVHKLEPWNSVRITLSIPREAAIRLRHLANEGSQQLRALGILSVQVEGDQVISLRLAGPEPQEIVLRTSQDGGDVSSANTTASVSSTPEAQAETASTSTISAVEKVQFRSPNVVCPTDTVVPKVPSQNATTNSALPNTRTYSGPFPFTSMNQAIHNRENFHLGGNYNAPPPPYPGKYPPVTMSSPLLVNLLQNDSSNIKQYKAEEQENENSLKPSEVAVQSNGTTLNTSMSKYLTAFNQEGTGSTSIINAAVVKTTSILSSNVTSITTTTTAPVSANSDENILSSQQPTQCTSSLLAFKTSSKQMNTNIGSDVINSTTTTTTKVSTLALSSATVNTSINSPATQCDAVINFSNDISSVKMVNEESSCSRETFLKSSDKACSNTYNTNCILNNTTSNRLCSSNTATTTTSTNYSSCSYESIPQLQELTPSLTELKETDLDHLLPTLEHDLTRSLPTLPEELTNKNCNYLINPLTGELEPYIDNSEIEEPSDVFTGLASPIDVTDEDTNSFSRPDTTDQSDSESKSVHSDSSKSSRLSIVKIKEKGRDSPILKPTEKIKLRLKLEKSEPISPAYKVDVSFINLSTKKPTIANVTSGEELRVPPLHISLRGRNHAVISSKKKIKTNLEDTATKTKFQKTFEPVKIKKVSSNLKENPLIADRCIALKDEDNALVTVDQTKGSVLEPRKSKKIKLNHDCREQNLLAGGHMLDKEVERLNYNSYLKERRGSDSELVHTIKKYNDVNGFLLRDKKRRLSHTDQASCSSPPFVLGSTNTGTVTTILVPKPRKEKLKIKDSSKVKEINRNRNFAKNVVEKIKQISLPQGEIDMEAKFKQRLMEEPGDNSIQPLHKTESLSNNCEVNKYQLNKDIIKDLVEPPIKDKLNQCISANDCKPELPDKQVGRSPNSGGQGEDSGIESMDALSEKSPNQSSQSPRTDITDRVKSKSQVPSILDIEAQLAKMEGLNDDDDVNENKHESNNIKQCCGLTSALQDSLKQRTVNLTTHCTPILKDQMPQVEASLAPIKRIQSKEDELPSIRRSPPRYTYCNSDKNQGSESPGLSDSDSNSCSSILKSKSLLEQLLIEIPDNHHPSSPSPVTRSLRTRASSKLSSPELNSPIPSKSSRMTITKRKRHESDSSSNSIDDSRNKKSRKCSENTPELIKTSMSIETNRQSVRKVKSTDDSSDSDEPLIEVAGKVRKNNINATRTKFKSSTISNLKTIPVKTRSSVRTIPALSTRSKGEKPQTTGNIRRKTRSSASEVDNKRRKEMK